jgi:hypothetical protein
MNRRRFTNLFRILAACSAALVITGCSHYGPPHSAVVIGPPEYYHAVGLTEPTPVYSVVAQCAPPAGWIAQPLKKSERHTHQIWLSPTGRTGYGVVHFKLPLPVGVNIVHWEFLREMDKREGEAIELSHQMDPSLPGMRFVCEGGRYKMRVNLLVSGFEGWAIYAATVREAEIIPSELDLAEKSRENTIIGLPQKQMSASGD